MHEIAARLGGVGGNGAVARKQGTKHPAKGTKIAAKYRHPKTGETWSGRGKKAGWLAKEIAAGKKLEDFAVDKVAAKPAPKAKGGNRGKVAAKYRHPKTGETWSGRGLRPRWLQAEIKAGKKIQAFAVK